MASAAEEPGEQQLCQIAETAFWHRNVGQASSPAAPWRCDPPLREALD